MQFTNINLNELRAAQLFSADDPIRPALGGVCFDHSTKHGLVLVATNGRGLAAIQMETEHNPHALEKDYNRVLGNDAIKLLFKVATRNDESVDVEFMDIDPQTGPSCLSRVRLSFPVSGITIEMKNKCAEFPFPLWRKAVPEADGKEAPAIQKTLGMKFFSPYIKAARLLTNDQSFQMYSAGELHPVVIRFPQYPAFYGVLMPIRENGIELTPDWVKP